MSDPINPFTLRNSVELYIEKQSKIELNEVDLAIANKVNEAVKKFIEEGQESSWCVVS